MSQGAVMITRCLLMMVLVHACRAAIGRGPATEHPDHPNKCWVEERKAAFDIGEKWQSKEYCMEHRCEKSNDGLQVSDVSCGSVSAGFPCTLTEDLTLDYPYCCPQIVCS